MKLSDYLRDINLEKKNLARQSSEKLPMFPIMRLLSYHPDAVLYVNEMNRLLSQHDKWDMIYGYLVYELPKRKRFAKMKKMEMNEDVELLMRHFNYSRQKAEQALSVLSEDELLKIRDYELSKEGGV